MRTGDLNCNLIFQAPSGSPVVWTTRFTCKGAVWPLTSTERIQALALGGTITGKVRIRYRPVKIKATWRILVGDSILAVAAPPINLGGKNEFLEIQVREAI